MKITTRQLRKIIRESLQLETTSYEREMGMPPEFVEANWEHWLDARGLLTSDLDDLAHYVGAPDQSWLPAAPPANGMIGPADIEDWAEERLLDSEEQGIEGRNLHRSLSGMDD